MEALPSGKACANCQTVLKEAKRCSRCKQAFYCSTACNQAHWSQHKKDCVAPAPHKSVPDSSSAQQEPRATVPGTTPTLTSQQEPSEQGSGHEAANDEAPVEARPKDDGYVVPPDALLELPVIRMRHPAGGEL